MKMLTIDIETSPHISAHFGRWNQNIPATHTLEEGRVICYAARWMHEEDTFFDAEWLNKKWLKDLWALLDEADVVIGYNSKKFDVKRINSEFLRCGMTPPSPYQQIDLFQQVRKHFSFSSNKLRDVLGELGLSPKLEEDVNFDLWMDILGCNIKHTVDEARAIMQGYNIQDVDSTVELYDFLLGWINPHPNWGLYLNDESGTIICPNCGSDNVVKKGVEHTQVRTYQRYKCKACGSHHRGRRNIGTPGLDNGVIK